jgi:hypothetical protein
MKYDAKSVRPGLQHRLCWDSPAAEHVVGVQNALIVKIDVGKRIQSVENQVDVIVSQGGRVHWERSLIFPIGQADPLKTKFIIAIERVGNELAAEQVGLYDPWNLCGMPLLNVGPISIGNGPELPARIDGSRGRLGCLQRYRDKRNEEQTSEQTEGSR